MKKSSQKNNRISKFSLEVKTELRENKWTFLTYSGLRILIIAIMIRQTFIGNYQNVFLCVGSLLLMLLPGVAQTTFRVNFPTPLEITMLVFIFAAEIMGELGAFYIKVPYWDTLLHMVNGFLCAAAGFSLIDILNRSEKFHMSLSPLFVSIVAFCVSMTVGVLWEFFEFGMDAFFTLDMQKDTIISGFASTLLDSTQTNTPIKVHDISEVLINGKSFNLNGYLDIGLIDTMEDLFVNFIGAFIFSVIGYFYIKNRKTNSIITNFVPVMKPQEENI